MLSSPTKRTVQCTLLVFLLLTGSSLGCGPGRGNARRRRPAKLTPLVYKEHVPSVSEYTIGASGPADGVITRNDPSFKELVENNNPNIIFKDEEGTGSDKMMSQRCKDKLNILAISVTNTWPGVKLRVTEAWDEDGHHEKGSLHYEGRAVDITTSDRDRSKYGMLARLAVDAGFDWVYYESRGHIHCSVKSDSSVAVVIGGCFPGSSLIQTEAGVKSMAEISVRDRVLSMSDNGILEFSEVIALMDLDRSAYGRFFILETENGRRISLTGKHLIYISRNNYTSTSLDSLEVIYADDVNVGDSLVTDENTDALKFSKVVNISVDTRQGIYAPLTKHGTIVVDGVVASCYAYINNNDVAHFVFAPLRLMYDVSEYLKIFILSASDPYESHKNALSTGMHWYANLLYQIGTRVLSTDMLFVH
ncbi:hypothetical protein CHS0354_030209 [Potamilus streckersoni]|uniref:Hedgehog protein n=1 Tax=Potamilus streckersoni TaxID=2493646 RepID=A0AAE0RSN8_9BIVA|nr:hypothetical protein CHS0354_030209 [Potamilus streckersoni]